MNISNEMHVVKIDNLCAFCICFLYARSLHRREWKRAQREAARQDAAEAAEEDEEIEEEQPSTSQQADESKHCQISHVKHTALQLHTRLRPALSKQ